MQRAWWGWVGGVLALAGCEPQPPLQWGPCEPERVAHVEGFGYYASSRHLEETASYSTLVWTAAADVARADAAGLRAIVYLDPVFRIADPARPSDEVVEQAWRDQAEGLRPLLGAVAALYPSDEPYWNGSLAGVPNEEVARRLEHAARLVRATAGFETVPIAVIFANPELDWMASGSARNPEGYGWVGFDYYGQPVERLERRGALLRSLLRPEQRVLVVPDAMLFAGRAHDLGGLEERIAFWLAWTERHPEVVAVAPFIYWTGGDSTASWTGAADLPTVRARYEQIGACIARSAAARAAAERARAR